MFQNSRTTAEHSLMAGTIRCIALGSRTYHTEFWAFHSKNMTRVVLELSQREADLVCAWANACNRNGTNISAYSCVAIEQWNQLYDNVCIHHALDIPNGYCMCQCYDGIQSPHSEVGLELDFGLLPTSLFFSFFVFSLLCIILSVSIFYQVWWDESRATTHGSNWDCELLLIN